MDSIYIYETRELDYFTSYLNKAKKIGYNPVVVSNNDLANDKEFAEFKSIYTHLSVNDYNFELNCFARYFAIANVLTNNDPFILSDSDIYLTNKKIVLTDSAFKNVFIGSEGFANGVTVEQISPHFSVWNRDMMLDFTNYLLNAYKRNHQDNFLGEYYEAQKNILGYSATAISDMTLLYMWVHDNKIPYINSNNAGNDWGIDHNISVLSCENAEYRSLHNRKKVEITTDGKINLILESGQRKEMSCLHFQGAYKQILNDFYLGDYKKFDRFSANVNFNQKLHYLAAGNKLKHYKALASQYQDIEAALDDYRDRLEAIPDELFNVKPMGDSWSYAQIYSYSLQEALAAIAKLEQCTQSDCSYTNKKLGFWSWLQLLLSVPAIVKTTETEMLSNTTTTDKFTKEDAVNLIIKCRQRIGAVSSLMHNANNNSRIEHPNLGMLNAKHWFKFIRIHLQHYLKQLQHTENKF
ncbi:MAG: hypothetical protein EOP47_06410 [Sphingobacteriaceae bacterium]|nr:MAG: hypothetical protein EOP47_06410 [Sphingobacteriaceae bacterium]